MNQTVYDYYVREKSHRAFRRVWDENIAEAYAAEGLSDAERMTRRFEQACSMEVPYIHPEEQICMIRTVKNLPHILTKEERAARKNYVHELGYVSNLCPDYAKVISGGLLAAEKTADAYQKRYIRAIIGLCDRYGEEAARIGRKDIADVFSRVPRYPARTLREALQFFRILHYFLWLDGCYHNTVGRFDQFMYPYFRGDIDSGVLTADEAQKLTDDFFLSFNKDSDLYFGQQQGDNGQSLVLGGRLPDGSDGFNELSRMALVSSGRLRVIDPKINLRVNKDTPLELYEKGTELTKIGLGFPQYSNDDVVIKGLCDLGYAYEDAVNYVVAACWEFIIPGCGDEIVNISTLSFPEAVNNAVHSELASCKSYEEFLGAVRRQIENRFDRIREKVKNVSFYPSPMMDLLRDPVKYRNFGIHGVGIASAADAIYSVKTHIFDKKDVTVERLLSALDGDYAADPELLHLLRYETPKMGQDNDEVDACGTFLLDTFAETLKGHDNGRGGRWRAGTGTAMFYLWGARDLGATAEGRRRGESFGTNFSPGLFSQVPGPVSDINSFTKADLSKTINGGPLTLEFASSVFSKPGSIRKVAQLVQYFVRRGGHQLQLNAVNAEELKDAQLHPEDHQQLVVRVWGWSAYFVELDKDFQDHVMQRREYEI